MRKHQRWFIGLAILALITTGWLHSRIDAIGPVQSGAERWTWGQPAQAQSPAPSAPAARPSPAPAAAPSEAIPPSASPPSNTAETAAPSEPPTTDTSATPAAPPAADAVAPPPPAPKPLASPPPEVAPTAEIATLPLSGDYLDPQARFQVGILDGYTTSSAANSPLFEAADGNLAYTVVVVPVIPDQPLIPVSDAALAQAAQDVFQRGEGFQATGFQLDPEGGIQISWTGSLTIGGKSQPMQGQILARQSLKASNRNIFLLLVATTESGQEQVPAAIATLGNSLQLL
ncbi:MAG: hypothetical protein F6K19_32415 [Cyanothece sp. SIO1E1]|nr:hypothetical protein [Cyanothece sp. SIO1E1]